jgi:hypothetical protein
MGHHFLTLHHFDQKVDALQRHDQPMRRFCMVSHEGAASLGRTERRCQYLLGVGGGGLWWVS